MGRREYRHTIRCAEPGCKEASFRVYETRADERDGIADLKRHPYRCTRHDKPDEVLRPDNTAVQHVLVASRIKTTRWSPAGEESGYLPGLFWLREGAERGGSGFTFGPGFNAHADDFPEGTRLVVTA
ncbi:MAG: hypothetical protein ACRDQH_10865, partial [Pseudonocardiaceae bacterium]